MAPSVAGLTGPPEPAALDYTALPPALVVLMLLLAGLALVGAALLARFLDRAVLRPAWTARRLPCENALYLLFSVAVADLLQASCVLVRGLQLLMAHWFLSRPLCRLWALLEAVAGTSRLLFMLAINGRLLRDGHWPRPLKIWLISLLWLLVIAGSYMPVLPIGVRHDRTCGPRYGEHAPAASLWQYVVNDAAGLALLPVAVGVYLWYRGRPPGDAAGAAADKQDQEPGSSGKLDSSDGNRTDAATSDHDATQAETTSADDGPSSDAEAVGAVAAPASPLPYVQRVRKLERCDTYTPSTFTLRTFWGMPSVDELSSSSGFTELGEGGGGGEEDREAHHRHCRLTLHQVAEVQRRVHLFVLLLSLAHFLFSLAASVVHVLTDLQLTEEGPWQTTALALDMTGQLQPLATVSIFSCMFSRFYKVLCK